MTPSYPPPATSQKPLFNFLLLLSVRSGNARLAESRGTCVLVVVFFPLSMMLSGFTHAESPVGTPLLPVDACRLFYFAACFQAHKDSVTHFPFHTYSPHNGVQAWLFLPAAEETNLLSQDHPESSGWGAAYSCWSPWPVCCLEHSCIWRVLRES